MSVKRVVPEALRSAIEPELPALAEEIVEVIRQEVPEYARPMRGAFGRGIRTGVEEALRRFGAPADVAAPDVYRALGRGEHAVGRSLDALQSAYRIGARVAWRRLSRAADAAGVPVADQHALAEAIFAYIDEIAAESVEGYAAAQAEQAGDRQRRREALLALLAGPVRPDLEVLRAAAADAGWPLPRTVAAVACAGDDPGRVARRLSGDALHGRPGGRSCVLLADPASPGPEVRRAAERLDTRLAIGPTLALVDAGRSLEWAVRALALAAADQPGVVVAEDHLPDLALRAAPDVLAALRTRALAPLDDETARSRDRLASTLRSWLGHAGARAAVARELGVHPQTVRYRVARLRELFGDRLDDPEARFALMLALRDLH